MQKIKIVCALVVGLLLLQNTAIYATVYYVNDNSATGDVYCTAVGNNANNGTSPATPKRTLANLMTTYAGSFVSGDVIYVDAGTYNDIQMNLSVDGVSIIGAGAAKTIFNNTGGNTNGYFMDITANNDTLRDMTIEGYINQLSYSNGSAITIGGGASLISGILLQNVDVSGNDGSTGNWALAIDQNASVTISGGGVYCNGIGSSDNGGVGVIGNNISLTIKNAFLGFNDNGMTTAGGALYISGNNTTKVVAENSYFEQNNATDGGAIYLEGGADLKVYDCVVHSNTTSPSYVIGGGGIRLAAGTMLITRSKIINNTDGYGHGGGICAYSSGGSVTLTVDSCSFSGNTSSSSGNDIYTHGTTTVTCFNSTFSSVATELVVGTGSLSISSCGTPSSSGVTTVDNNAPTYAANPVTPTYTGTCGSIVLSTSFTLDSIKEVSCNGSSDGAIYMTSGGTSFVWTNGSGTVVGNSADLVGVPAGTYTLTVDGTTTYGPYTITQPTALSGSVSSFTNVGCKGDSSGSATVSVSGGTSPYNYSWGPYGGTANAASNLAAGNYTVTVTDAHGCSVTISVTITEPASALTLTIDPKTNVGCKGDSSGSATVNAIGGTGPYTYSWSPYGGTGATASNLVAGTYIVTVADNNGCSTKDTAIITEPANALSAATSSQTNVLCKSDSSGSATVTASGGVGAYTYLWSPYGGTAATANNLAAGTYTVSVGDGNGCSTTDTVIITEPANALSAATSSQSNVLCKSDSSGSATVTASGGAGAYTYSWMPYGGTAATANNLAAGTYTVSIGDGNGCSTKDTVIITEPANVLSASTTSQTNVYCKSDSSGSATVTASGGSGAYTYSWAPYGGTSATANNLAVGTYTVTVGDGNGCSTSDTVIITEPANALALVVDPKFNVNCKGDSSGSATVNALGGTAPYNYSWSPYGGTAASASNLAAGTYIVTVADTYGCSKKDTIIITEPASALSATTSSQTNVFCNSDSSGSATVMANGGVAPYTYSWSPYGGTNATANNLTAGTYTIMVGDSNGCSTADTVIITEPANALSVATSSQANVLCKSDSSGSAVVTANGGVAPYTYSWAPYGGTAATANNLVAGTYTVSIGDGNGCSTSDTVVITEPANALSATTSSQSNVLCKSDSSGSATIAASGGTGGYTYSWLPYGGTSAAVNNLGAGTYTVTVADGNGCSTKDTITITEPANALSANVSSQSNVSCKGGNSGSATINVNGGTAPYAYAWSPSGGTSNTASDLSAGAYTVAVTDSNGCSANANVTITEPASGLSVNVTSQNSHCGYANGSVMGVASGGTGSYSYAWSPGGQTTASDSGLVAGTYTLTVTDSLGCQTTGTATINSVNNVVAGFTPSATNGTSPLTIDFSNTSTGANSYFWYFGDNSSDTSTTPSHLYTQEGNYNVYLVASNGTCADTAYAEIDVQGTLNVVIPNVFTPNGDGQNDIFNITITNGICLSMTIYDRWGVLIYNWKGPGLNASWDGRTSSGKQVSAGTYYYIIVVTDQENNNHHYYGNVTLIR